MIALKLLLLAMLFPTQTPPDTTGPLATPHVDGSYGFSVAPPINWRLDRRRITDAHGVTLLRMFGSLPLNRVEEIEIKRTAARKRVSLEERLKQVHHAMQLEYSDVDVQARQVQQISGRPGALVTATLWREGTQWLRLHAIVDIDEEQYFEIIYSGPADVRSVSEPLFHQVLASFVLLSDEIDKAAMATALKRGVDWMAGLKPDRLHKAILPEQIFRIERNGKLIGLLRVYETEHVWEKHPGIRIRERGWTCEPDGRVTRLQTTMFVSDDLRHERWKSSITTLVPEEGAQPEHLEVALEEGLRSQDILISNQAYQLGQPTTANPALKMPETYISRPLLRMFPRLINDLQEPRRLAFTTFDHQTTDLIYRVISLHGPADNPTGITRGKVFRIDEREGVAANPSNLYVDERGRIRLIDAGPLRMTPDASSNLSGKFDAKIEAASKRMDDLERAYNESVGRFRR